MYMYRFIYMVVHLSGLLALVRKLIYFSSREPLMYMHYNMIELNQILSEFEKLISLIYPASDSRHT